jgi:cytochrome b
VTSEASQRLIWDWTIRLFHWWIVFTIPMMWWTAEQGLMDWHRRLGMMLFSLVVFRLVWGLIGARTARFVPMLISLRQLGGYVRNLTNGAHKISYGHSPLGVLSVFALLLALTTQISTGLFSVDVDGLESGPLAVLISFDLGRELADLHELNFNILCALIVLHVAAILGYRFVLGDRLIKPMITGHRPNADFSGKALPPNQVGSGALVVALIVSGLSVFAVLQAG